MSIYDKLKSPEFYSYVRLKVKNHLVIFITSEKQIQKKIQAPGVMEIRKSMILPMKFTVIF